MRLAPFSTALLVVVQLLAAPFAARATAVPGAKDGPHNAAWMTSKKDTFERARREKKLVIVDAFANWCGWCKKLDKDVLDTPAFIEATKKDYVLLRLNTEDGKEGTAYAQQFQIGSLPTTLVLDSDETVIGRISGYVKMEEFLNYLTNFRKAYGDLRQRDAEARGKRSEEPDFVLQIANEWQARGEAKKAMELLGKVADSKKAPAQQRARAAFNAAASALKINNTSEAEKRLRQLDQITPFPADMDGLPEILRSDIAAVRGDLDTAIRILEELMAKGNPNGEWRATLPNRINDLKNSKRIQEMQPKPVPPQTAR